MSGKQSIHRVNDVDINMFEVGRGTPTLLFLHYWGGSIRSWRPVMEDLSESRTLRSNRLSRLGPVE